MKRKINIAAVMLIVAVLIAAFLFSLRDRNPCRAETHAHLVMGTFARVIALAPDPKTASEARDAALAKMHEIDELMSDYKDDSEISRVNAGAFDTPVKVGPETYEVIKKSVEFSRLTDGAFDITVGPLVQLFRTAQKTAVAPAPEQIAQAKSKVGYEKLILSDADQTVRFAVEGMSLDLGGIAKGYAIDKALEAMKKCGATGAMVDIGGDVRCFGTPPKGRQTWLIGLQNPNADDPNSPGLLLKLKILNAAVATSGDYQQFAIIDGKKLSHIIDRATGSGAEGLSGVTVIAPTATDADALATAVTVLGPEKGLALIKKLPNTEAILISSPPEYKLTKTSSADKYIQKK